MIITLKGTSGAGKTTLVKKVLEKYGSKTTYFKPGRKRPIGYLYNHKNGGKPLAVIGHYEVACGGCDTIQKTDEIFDYIKQADEQGYDVLFEGLLLSAEVNRNAALHLEGRKYKAIFLTTPIDLCVESVNLRRRAKNPEKPDVDPENTIAKTKAIRKTLERMIAHGCDCVEASREEAFEIICKEFQL